MMHFDVGGMSCAACSARVEKAVSKVAGVEKCEVNLLTNSMNVQGSADAQTIIAAVQAAGYTASVKGQAAPQENALRDRQTPQLVKRLISSVVFLVLLMYASMGHMMWGWPLPTVLTGDHMAIALIQLLLCTAVMVINRKFFINGAKGLIKGSPNMDTLVALGSGAAYVWSVAVMFMMSHYITVGNAHQAHTLMHELYFESAAMILTLITVGKMLEARSKGKTTDAIKSLMKLTPDTATLLRDGREVTVAAKDVKIGDIFCVKAGERIPVDAVIISGNAAVDESALTGESVPVDKAENDRVSAATILSSGYIQCRAAAVGEDTAIAKIIKMVSDAAATKAPIAKIADKVSGIFVPTVIAVSVVTFIVWMITGAQFSYALARAISVLVISCPCALGLATPVAIMVGSGVGAKNGILFKTAVSLETTGKVRIAAVDKTGTVTEGKPVVTDIVPADSVTSEQLLKTAYALEIKSEHPLAQAINNYCTENGVCAEDTQDFKTLAGSGISASINGQVHFGGSFKFISATVPVTKKVADIADKLAQQGKTPLLFASHEKIYGIIAVADAVKPDSAQAVKKLKDMGIRVVMLTGDNERTAKAIGSAAGVDEIISGVLPDEKANVINRLKKQGVTAMVGDGINDAPALTAADVGIAIGAGADVALDAADVVLVKSSLADVPAAINLSRHTILNIRENLFWAFIYNVIGIPLAAGVFVPLGITLSPMFGAAAMSLSSFCVVSNALRLNLCKIYGKKSKGSNVMTENKKVLKIEGMMCQHCVAHVKQALEGVAGVEDVQVDLKGGTAQVTLSAATDDAALVGAVEKAGYKAEIKK